MRLIFKGQCVRFVMALIPGNMLLSCIKNIYLYGGDEGCGVDTGARGGRRVAAPGLEFYFNSKHVSWTMAVRVLCVKSIFKSHRETTTTTTTREEEKVERSARRVEAPNNGNTYFSTFTGEKREHLYNNIQNQTNIMLICLCLYMCVYGSRFWVHASSLDPEQCMQK